MEKKILKYINDWRKKGYPKDIPDEVPHELMKLCLAPSYKAVCLAILNNDHSLKSLGVVQEKSMWYNVLKKIEINKRGEQKKRKKIQYKFFNFF